jgi:CubicO group peptidase (beta-lactamase class C family)
VRCDGESYTAISEDARCEESPARIAPHGLPRLQSALTADEQADKGTGAIIMARSATTILRGAVAAIAALLASPALAQQAPATAPPGTAFNRAGADTARHQASAAAATRAIALCSGLWTGGQTRAMIDRDNPERPNSGIIEAKIDETAKIVSAAYDKDMPPRIVAWRPVLGCVLTPPGTKRADLNQLPKVRAGLAPPNLDAQPWPTGDAKPEGKLSATKKKALDAVVAAAFDDKTYGANTWGIVVVKDGKIVAEKYALGYDIHVGEQTHSAAKSFAASVVGIAVRKFGLDIHKAPVLSEWSAPGDPRGMITVEHLIRMSSGLYGEGNGSPQMDIYSAGGTVAGRAVSNMLDTMPGTRFLYNPPDTMLMMRAVREQVKNDAAFLELPFTDLFWKVGMTRTVTSSDWNGDFLMSGQTYSTARDFARFGLLYLADGVWNGERILPEGWSKYVATKGPAQPAGNGARYGAHFWIYGGMDGLAADAYSPNGGQGQYAMIVPSENVVVVRRGHDAGGSFKIPKFSADVIAALKVK